jgi:hypothetical protein
MTMAIPDRDRDPESEFREGLHRGIALIPTFVAKVGDRAGMQWLLGTYADGAAELRDGVPARHLSLAAKTILRELHRDEEFGRTHAFNLGLHVSFFVGLGIVDDVRYRRLDAISRAIHEAEDVAATYAVGRLVRSPDGTIATILAEVRRRVEDEDVEYEAGRNYLHGYYGRTCRYGD